MKIINIIVVEVIDIAEVEMVSTAMVKVVNTIERKVKERTLYLGLKMVELWLLGELCG